SHSCLNPPPISLLEHSQNCHILLEKIGVLLGLCFSSYSLREGFFCLPLRRTKRLHISLCIPIKKDDRSQHFRPLYFVSSGKMQIIHHKTHFARKGFGLL